MKKSILLWSCMMLFIMSPTATVALAGDWTEVPFPAEEVFYLAEDSEGNLWAIPSISKVDVYVLKKDGDSWQDASEGLDKSTPTSIADFQTFGDKLFLQTAHDIFIREVLMTLGGINLMGIPTTGSLPLPVISLNSRATSGVITLLALPVLTRNMKPGVR